jgi:uncharacterized protein (DUF885 family)
MMRRYRGVWISCALLVLSMPLGAAPDASEQAKPFHDLIDDEWEFRLRQDPLFASYAGDHRYDDRLPSMTVDDQQHRADTLSMFLERLHAIDRAQLHDQDQISYTIFEKGIQDRLEEFHYNSYLMPVTAIYGFHAEFIDLHSNLAFVNTADYGNYIKRLEAFPAYMRQEIGLMREGVRKGLVVPRVVMKGFDKAMGSLLVDSAQQSTFYEPFQSMSANVSPQEQKRLRAEAARAIMTDVIPAYRAFISFVDSAYIPHCRETIGLSAIPHGHEFYAYWVRHFTTLNITPQEVHAIGLEEVERIQAEMKSVMAASGYSGDLQSFIAMLRTDPRFYAKSPDELLKDAALICKRMDGELPHLFKTLPRTPYGIKEIPAYAAPKSTGAYYQPPPGDGRNAGYYFVNTYNLSSRPLYVQEALSFHESVPGHHLQIALQQELTGLPPFRRVAEVTAFVEGWGLYAERLGLEVGFYTDVYSNFGRLSYEMWRACRLVVDTGIHEMGWSRQEAIDYMSRLTALSVHEITTEVDRYISDPGQALAYKIGELKIRELRKKAEQELGKQFDVREFHDVVLRNGAITLPLLEEEVMRYIASSKNAK